ncbi:hypothetical protein N7539_007448 [Penicillium diatomitis]|uniref:GPI anchored cell wall protein n=1 Tax=Penicillium diatomitis TaxID=2819901 RepID=A0A9X0BNV0_9EURO|nr:uncharacterized protein N7539_007448 [Penicillium diatomitis]KAJ5477304.1 hypothetical protein N7539_007448 [Penicillium diatomitis]
MSGISLFLLSILGSLAVAAAAPSSTVVSYLVADDILDTWVAASVIAVNPKATTYEVKCVPSASASDCSLDPPITLIAGPTTVNIQIPLSESTRVGGIDLERRGLMTMACSFTHSIESITCTATEAMTAIARGVTKTSTGSQSGSILPTDASYKALTVTGGLEKFQASATSAPTSATTSNPADRVMVTGMPFGAAVAVAAAAAWI